MKLLSEYFRGRMMEHIPVDEKKLERFCSGNKLYWNKDDAAEPCSGNGSIVIGLFMVEKWISFLERKFIQAKGIQSVTNLPIQVWDWNYNPGMQELCNSYGADYITVKDKMLASPSCMFGAFCGTVNYLLKARKIEDLENLKFKKMGIGYYVYDIIVRSNGDIYTIDASILKSVKTLKKVFFALLFAGYAEKLIEKEKPVFYLFDDIVYDEGILVRLLQKKSAKMCRICDGNFAILPQMDDYQYWEFMTRPRMQEDLAALDEEGREKLVELAEGILEKRLSGSQAVSVEDVAAFANKCTDKERLYDELGLDRSKKNVVLFAGCLSENAHTCSFQIYRDTYTWLTRTLEYAKQIEDVNWIVKEHPIGESKYGEAGVVQGIVEKYSAPHIFFFPGNYLSSMAGELADVIITPYGTAAMEYSCRGVPCIMTASPRFTHFGYTIEPKSEEEYRQLLEKLSSIERLDSEKIHIAKLVFGLEYTSKRHYLDEYEKAAIEFDKRLTLNKSKTSIKDINDEALDYYSGLIEKDEVRKTEWYKQGCLFAEQR